MSCAAQVAMLAFGALAGLSLRDDPKCENLLHNGPTILTAWYMSGMQALPRLYTEQIGS